MLMLVAVLWGAAASSALMTIVFLVYAILGRAAQDAAQDKSDRESVLFAMRAKSEAESAVVATLVMVVLTGGLVALAVYFQNA